MEINVIEQSDKKIVFELKGADHTFCNELKEELWNDDAVTAVAYAINHPLLGIPKFTVELKRKIGFSTIFKKAIDRIQKRNKEFLTAIKKVK